MHILILGGNSDIGSAIAHKFAKEKGAKITLASRNIKELEEKARDISIRYQVSTQVASFDASDYENHQEFYKNLEHKPDGVILAFGYTNNQFDAQNDFKTAYKSISTNYVGAVSILEIIASDFEKKGRGFIIGISSVAGDRGRQSNYIYGSAKAALSAYLSGLRNRLVKSGVHVLTVKPGFVRTKMTADMDLPDKITLTPDEAAENIFNAWKKGKNTTYTKWFWKLIMMIIKSIPEPVFKRLNL